MTSTFPHSIRLLIRDSPFPLRVLVLTAFPRHILVILIPIPLDHSPSGC